MEDKTYRAPHYDPTVDELETLKQLEMGVLITQPEGQPQNCTRRCGGYFGAVHRAPAGCTGHLQSTEICF